jgi:hypothetical protein
MNATSPELSNDNKPQTQTILVTPVDSTNRTGWIIGVVLLAVILIIIIVLSVYYSYYNYYPPSNTSPIIIVRPPNKPPITIQPVITPPAASQPVQVPIDTPFTLKSSFLNTIVQPLSEMDGSQLQLTGSIISPVTFEFIQNNILRLNDLELYVVPDEFDQNYLKLATLIDNYDNASYTLLSSGRLIHALTNKIVSVESNTNYLKLVDRCIDDTLCSFTLTY